MIHELKQLTGYFDEVLEGVKTFEVRKFDRPFKVGDMLALNEWDGKGYTGRSCLVYVDYILSDEKYCKEGYIILGIKPCEVYAYYQFPRHNPLETKATYKVPVLPGGKK